MEFKVVEKSLQQLQAEYLQEVITRFNSTNRGLNERGLCRYTAGCAVGYRLIESGHGALCEKLDDQLDSQLWAIFEHLPASLRVYGSAFLSSLQKMHDNGRNWSTSGLSEDGIQEAERIRREFRLTTPV